MTLSSNRHPALLLCLSMIFFRKPASTLRDHAPAGASPPYVSSRQLRDTGLRPYARLQLGCLRCESWSDALHGVRRGNGFDGSGVRYRRVSRGIPASNSPVPGLPHNRAQVRLHSRLNRDDNATPGSFLPTGAGFFLPTATGFFSPTGTGFFSRHCARPGLGARGREAPQPSGRSP
jgi:hypothetical protein